MLLVSKNNSSGKNRNFFPLFSFLHRKNHRVISVREPYRDVRFMSAETEMDIWSGDVALAFGRQLVLSVMSDSVDRNTRVLHRVQTALHSVCNPLPDSRPVIFVYWQENYTYKLRRHVGKALCKAISTSQRHRVLHIKFCFVSRKTFYT